MARQTQLLVLGARLHEITEEGKELVRKIKVLQNEDTSFNNVSLGLGRRCGVCKIVLDINEDCCPECGAPYGC